MPRFASFEPDKLRLSLTTQASGWLRCYMNNSVGEDEHQFLMTVSGMSLSAEVSFCLSHAFSYLICSKQLYRICETLVNASKFCAIYIYIYINFTLYLPWIRFDIGEFYAPWQWRRLPPATDN